MALAVLLGLQPRKRPMHFDHGESIALATGKELATQVDYLLRKRNSARGEL